MIKLPELPESEHCLAYYDEGGMHDANDDGYDEEQMKEFAFEYGERVRLACFQVAKSRYMGDNNREDMEARRIAEEILKISLQ